MAPDRVVWARDDRSTMVRVVDSAETGTTHIENRIGEPAANPYLYLASQLHAGLDGIDHALDPAPLADIPLSTEAPRLPARSARPSPRSRPTPSSPRQWAKR
jgi:glutamine synthetase